MNRKLSSKCKQSILGVDSRASWLMTNRIFEYLILFFHLPNKRRQTIESIFTFSLLAFCFSWFFSFIHWKCKCKQNEKRIDALILIIVVSQHHQQQQQQRRAKNRKHSFGNRLSVVRHRSSFNRVDHPFLTMFRSACRLKTVFRPRKSMAEFICIQFNPLSRFILTVQQQRKKENECATSKHEMQRNEKKANTEHLHVTIIYGFGATFNMYSTLMHRDQHSKGEIWFP